MDLYIKNKKGNFIPVDITNTLSKDLDNHLIIVRVGSEQMPADTDDLTATAESFTNANILDQLDNTSIIITPHSINIEIIDQKEIDNKTICIQIKDGEDLSSLDNMTKSLYKILKKKYQDVTLVPSPLSIREYRQVKDTLKRCKMRKRRRFKDS